MAAVAGGPGLSALLNWPTDHLTEAASHWESVGEQSFGVAHGVWSDAMVADWKGEAAEALRTDTHADMTTTSAAVDRLQGAATAARSGASELEAARSYLQYAVDDARSSGFTVGEDLSVTDQTSGGSAAQRVARQVMAQSHAGEIGARAAALVNTDAQVASRVTAAVSGVGSTFPPAPPNGGQIRAVDNHTFKMDPATPIKPEDMTEAEARAAWAEVNAEVNAYNTRCGRTFILPTEQGAYDTCVADKQRLLDKQAAIRARLHDLKVPIEDEESAQHPEEGKPPFPPPEQINGLTDHGAKRVFGREGHGVNDEAMQDAVRNPVRPPKFVPDEYGGTWRYDGKDATVCLNESGQVTTAWPNGSGGWRNP
ncbi:hypothetical protein PT015_21885 [Candidatus Mycobacterium wuenschmannii]|uniref:Transmembrane protein n=1 Tax=Candidatus Mycobacterium wuenschmannii TaxID=3027808 RepID=A0ABY8W105_9MYCO|nr:hypothetical protein [Candidatus Mycobacterium wuenschmannii]WIM87459.1 hypothetical protein PT015_21885 [Candidatus Mycobacterium wuenschmannii]